MGTGLRSNIPVPDRGGKVRNTFWSPAKTPPGAAFRQRAAPKRRAYRIAALVFTPQSADRIKWTLPPNENANAGRTLLVARCPVAVGRRDRFDRPAADGCDAPGLSQAELNDCYGNAYKKADAELNVLCRQITARLKDDKATTKLLVAAQRAWVAFRDAECAFLCVRGFWRHRPWNDPGDLPR